MLLDLVMDGIQSDDGINGLQVAFTTGLQFDQLVGNRIQRTVGQGHAVDFSDMAADIPITVAQAKQGDDFAFQLIGQMGLVPFDQLWFESAHAASEAQTLRPDFSLSWAYWHSCGWVHPKRPSGRPAPPSVPLRSAA